MRIRLIPLILLLLLSLVFLNACSPDAGASPAVDDGIDPDPADLDPSQLAEEGSATVNYFYYINDPNLEFKINLEFGVGIGEGAEEGSWDVSGIQEKNITFKMGAAGGPTGSCQIICDVILRYEAVGKVDLDPKTGQCTIPINFRFQPQLDEWILTGDCPEEAKEVINCAALSGVLADPTTYTFTAAKRDPNMSQDSSVTLKAIISDLKMPSGLTGLCSW